MPAELAFPPSATFHANTSLPSVEEHPILAPKPRPIQVPKHQFNENNQESSNSYSLETSIVQEFRDIICRSQFNSPSFSPSISPSVSPFDMDNTNTRAIPITQHRQTYFTQIQPSPIERTRNPVLCDEQAGAPYEYFRRRACSFSVGSLY